MTNKPITTDSLLGQDNHLIALAGTGRLRVPQSLMDQHPVLFDKVLYPLAVILFGLIAPFLSAFIGIPLLLPLFLGVISQETATGQVIILVGSFLPLFLLIWFWLWLFERRPLKTVGMERPILRKYLRGLLLGLLMFAGAVALLALLGMVDSETTGGGFSLVSVSGALIIILGWIVQGAAEEVLTRGFILPIIGRRWGILAGILISSLLFAFLHLLNPNVTLISIINLALFGLFAALYALYEGGLWGVFAIHSIWNWAQGNLFGFEVSGTQIPSGMIFDLMETGPDWITGGEFGPEGGLVVTIVLVISSLLILLAARRRGKILD
ncbi:MAG: type II CAAX endopeptidase family protein [Candidatus Promineifilaceae bacterium]|nr:type II CAAX endopeptidase family protein [Candidatus Promineifilaceae bacterium]